MKIRTSSAFQKKAFELRKGILKLAKMSGGGGAHLGGTLSCVEILTYLYLVHNIRISKKNWDARDRVLVKGHVHLALYQLWSDIGLIKKKELQSYGKNGSRIHILPDIKIPGSEYNSGSLGQVVGIGLGIAISSKIDKKKYNVFCIVGDGECDSGSMWESVSMAGKLKTKNLIVIVDLNRLSEFQIFKDNVHKDIEKKFRSFEWNTKIINGHSYSELKSAFKLVKNTKKPLAIIANTIKGKGVSFMENNVNWHHKAPNKKEFEIALKEYEK